MNYLYKNILLIYEIHYFLYITILMLIKKYN